MCISAAALLGYAATAGQVAGGLAAVKSLTSKPGGGPNAAEVQAAADARATQTANSRLAARRKALSSQSLATGGGDLMSSGVLAGGKPTLGG